MRRLRNKARRRTTRSASSFVCSSYARRLRAEQLEDRRMLATFAVTNLDDAGAGSLREAIAMASTAPGADTIEFASGVGEAFENGGVIRLSSQLDISDANELTIDGSTAGGEVIITGDAGNDDAKVGATEITDAVNNSMTSDNVRVFDITSGTINLNNLTITGGATTSDGGGVLVNLGATLNLLASIVSGNVARGTGDGGGIANYGTTAITGSTVSGNTGNYGGGIINSTNDMLTITDTTIAGNAATNDGGGVANFGTAVLTGVTLVGNTTSLDGGGLHNSTGDNLTLTNVTVTGNTATVDGGGVHNLGNATLNNTIVLGNNSGAFGAETSGTGITSNASLTSGSASVVFATTQMVGGVAAGVLTNNGGTIQTVALLNDSTNPALDIGTFSTTAITHDAVGNPRVVDFPSVDNGGFVDAGALELQIGTVVPIETPSLVVSITGDGINVFDGETSLREAINFANSQGGADTITFEAALSGQTITLGGTELEITDTLTIDASALNDKVTIDANQGSRVLHVSSSTGDLTIHALTITGGRTTVNSDGGGGIRFGSSGTLLVTDSTVSGNSTTGDRADGGGIYTDNGAVTVTGSTVSGNTTTGGRAYGGGIYTKVGTLEITGSDVTGNSTMGAISAGGGIHTEDGTVTITNSTVGGNSTAESSSDGGGINTDGGSVTVTGSLITGNSTSGQSANGGGINSFGGNVIVTSSTVSGNSTAESSSDGGGINTDGGSLTVTSSSITENSTTGGSADGGGIAAFSSEVIIMGSTVSGNTTTGDFADGGGIDATSSQLTVTGSTVSGNSTTGVNSDGGGISSSTNLSDKTTTITNSTISGNATASHGGGLYNLNGLTIIRSSTITANTAPVGLGSGVASRGSNYTRTESTNSIIAGNTNEDVAVVSFNSNNSFQSNGHNLIGIGGGILDGAAKFTATGDIIGADSQLGPLDDNGGPTKTHALMSGSPAIDAGDPTLIAGTGGVPLFDQRGLPEVRVRNGRIDMGAVETPGTVSVSLVVSNSSDTVDGDWSTGQLSLREALLITNTNVGTDAIRFDPDIFTGGAASLIRQNGTELTISDDVTIDGSTGTDIVITADSEGNDQLLAGTFITDTSNNTTTADNSRVLNITGGTVDLNGLTMTGGFTSGDGGGIIVGSGATLNLAESTISGNRASESGDGGGLANYGTTSIANSTISGNRGRYGGGIINSTADMLTITGSTISGNAATDDGGGVSNFGITTFTNVTVSNNTTAADGGGVHNSTNDTLVLNNVTLFGNGADGTAGGGGIHNLGTATLNNTIVAGSASGGDLSGTFSGRYNLIEDGNTAGLTATLSGDPLLEPLADNGGATQTHALPLGSRAINTGDPDFDPGAFTPPLTTDQRGDGFNRVALGQIDIGAYEAAQLEAPATGNDIQIQRHADPSRLLILLDGISVASVAIAQPDDIAFVSQAGKNQTLTINYGFGYFDPTGTISFVGNSVDNDQLRVVGDTNPRLTRATYKPSGNFGTDSIYTGNGAENDTLNFFNLSSLDFDNLLSFSVDGFLAIAASESLTVAATNFVDLDSTTVLNGAVFDASNGFALGSGEILSAAGTYNNTPVDASSGSVIQGTGDLALGDTNSVIGYFSDGVLHTSANTVTINDANEAVLGSLTTLGDGTNGGRLVAGTSTPNTATDNRNLPDNFLLEDGKNVTGRGSIAGNFRNMGSVIGDGTALAERIQFEDGFTVNGIGFAQNVIYNGTFAPGLSPGIANGENMAFAGNLQIELGGTTPGTGNNNHDQVNDAGQITLIDGVDLEIKPWNGFEPSVGDEFEILTAAGALAGRFDAVTVDSAFTNAGIDFQLRYTDNGLTLTAVEVSTDGDFDNDGDTDGADFLAWQRGFGTTHDASDLNDWQQNFGQTQSIAAAESMQALAPVSPIEESVVPQGELQAGDSAFGAAIAWDLLASQSDDNANELPVDAAVVDNVFHELEYSGFGSSPIAYQLSVKEVAAIDDEEVETLATEWISHEVLEDVFG